MIVYVLKMIEDGEAWYYEGSQDNWDTKLGNAKFYSKIDNLKRSPAYKRARDPIIAGYQLLEVQGYTFE